MIRKAQSANKIVICQHNIKGVEGDMMDDG